MGEKKESKSEESEHESEEDESEILEESPCGRWLKRSEEVSQRNVPGIDRAYLAMDSEEGVEVVWNEVQFSERKSFKQQEEKIKAVFDNLMRIDHANIVKFHRYWVDYSKEQSQKTRVVFITEYMSSGSVKEFLNKTKDIQKYKRTKSWKRWCTQILSALSYLHNCTPPVIHGNMTCDTIFIQHNGLVKIGSVAPDAIRNHVKTYHEIKRNMHYYAPEYGTGYGITPAVDIYSFGICALEMAVPRTQLHYRESKSVTEADIDRAIDILEDPNQRDFIRLCLQQDPTKRPSARSLLLHPLLFEVHSLRLLAAHAFVKNERILPEYIYKQKELDKEFVSAEVSFSSTPKVVKRKDVPAFDLDKFLEDVKNGVYPLTSYALPRPPWAASHPSMPSQSKGTSSEGQMSSDQAEDLPETRKIIFAQGTITPTEKCYGLILQLRFEDKMNRHLNCEIFPHETAETLSSELVQYRLIKETDKDLIKLLLEDGLKTVKGSKSAVHFSSGKLSNESTDDIPSAIATQVNPVVTPSAMTDNYRLLYSNLQTLAANPVVPQIPAQQLHLVQSSSQPVLPTQTIGSSVVTIPPLQQQIASQPQANIQYQQQPQLTQLTMQPLQQQVIQTHIQGHPNLAQPQQQYLVQPAQQATVLSMQPQQSQLQYAQHVQFLQQTQQPMPQANPAQLAAQQTISAQVIAQPQVVAQAQPQMFQQQQVMQQSQSLYLQQQPMVIQQSQTPIAQATQSAMVQRQVQYQATPTQIPPHSQQHQPQAALTQMQQPNVLLSQSAVGQHVVPVLHYNQAGNPIHIQPQQQTVTVSQAAINPTLLPQAQPVTVQAVRLPAQPVQAGNIQRSTSFFSLPHHQTVQPQSSNNSNNIIFSRSNSRVDEGVPIVGQSGLVSQQAVLLQHVTPHSSIASVSSSLSEHEMAGATISPPTSAHIVANGGGDISNIKGS